MPASAPRFLTLHALRIKGFAQTVTVAELADRPVDEVERHLAEMQDTGLATFRSTKALWQLTPEGREAHATLLVADLADVAVSEMHPLYQDFLVQNIELKQVCTDWQVRAGEANDHGDIAYDSAVIDRLVALHESVSPVIDAMAAVVGRLSPYGRRLGEARDAVVAGDTHRFTGVLCSSFHDVWMEFHEDLILTQGIDRSREGSF